VKIDIGEFDKELLSDASFYLDLIYIHMKELNSFLRLYRQIFIGDENVNTRFIPHTLSPCVAYSKVLASRTQSYP
jgi:hypothetical protein